VVARVVIVQQVIVPRRAVAVAERRVGEAVQIREDCADARRRVVGAARVAAAICGSAGAIAVLPVVVVGARLRVRVFDFARRRRGRVAVGILVVGGIAGAERDVIGAGSAHYGLVVVVRDRVVLRQEVERRSVAGGHVVEAHVQRALVRRLIRERARRRLAVGV